MLCLDLFDFHVLTSSFFFFIHICALRSFIVLTLLFLCLLFFFLPFALSSFGLHSLICILVLHFLNTPLCLIWRVHNFLTLFCFTGAGYHQICKYSSISFTQLKDHISIEFIPCQKYEVRTPL